MFVALYTLIYMAHAVYNTFFPVYLDYAGFGRTAIGSLMALGPFVTMIAQPVWGAAGDKARSKNSILKILAAGCGLLILLYPLYNNYYYTAAIIVAFTFFQTSIYPISDAITLEHLSLGNWKFGPIRMAGTISFAVMVVITGSYLKENINSIFPLYSAICLLVLITVFLLPKVKGHQYQGNKVPLLRLFKNRDLVLLMAFNLTIQISLSYYYGFFPIFYKSLGGDNKLLGLTQFAAAISEIPFLLFADRIIRKIGTKGTMIITAFVFTIRWFLFSVVSNIYALIFINMLHGFGYIVINYCMAVYIDRNVPPELKASGQTMNGLIGLGAARIIGSIMGGYLSDTFGMSKTFLIESIFMFAAVLLFGSIFFRNGLKEIKD